MSAWRSWNKSPWRYFKLCCWPFFVAQVQTIAIISCFRALLTPQCKHDLKVTLINCDTADFAVVLLQTITIIIECSEYYSYRNWILVTSIIKKHVRIWLEVSWGTDIHLDPICTKESLPRSIPGHQNCIVIKLLLVHTLKTKHNVWFSALAILFGFKTMISKPTISAILSMILS